MDAGSSTATQLTSPRAALCSAVAPAAQRAISAAFEDTIAACGTCAAYQATDRSCYEARPRRVLGSRCRSTSPLPYECLPSRIPCDLLGEACSAGIREAVSGGRRKFEFGVLRPGSWVGRSPTSSAAEGVVKVRKDYAEGRQGASRRCPLPSRAAER